MPVGWGALPSPRLVRTENQVWNHRSVRRRRRPATCTAALSRRTCGIFEATVEQSAWAVEDRGRGRCRAQQVTSETATKQGGKRAVGGWLGIRSFSATLWRRRADF